MDKELAGRVWVDKELRTPTTWLIGSVFIGAGLLKN